jgi:bacillithiol synthase
MLRVESLPADVLGLSELSRRALSGKLDLDGFPVARSLAQLEAPEERFTPEERAHLSRWLESQLSPLEAHVHVLESVRELRTPGASCVITGHQPGFLCSPLLILYKAVQCIALSRQLSAHWKRPVVPVFWNHADDHDLAEVHHAPFLNRNFDLQKAGLAGLSSGRQPLSRIRIDQDKQRLTAVRALFRHIFGDYPRIDEALESFMPEDGMTFAGSLTRNLMHIFGKHGLVVVEPDWFREESSSALAQVVSADPAAKIAASEQELIASGLEVAIPVEEAALVYRVDSSGRHPLRVGGEGFRYDEEPGSRTRAELAAEIVQEPAAWSAGALLRPIVQDMVLPVAAQVGGHGELAYHAQLGHLRRAVGAPCTPFVPRVSITLIEVEMRASAKRVGATPQDIMRARGQWTPAGEERETPPVIEELRRLADVHAEEILAKRKELGEVEPALAPHLRRAVALYKGAILKLAEKAARAEANRTGKGERHLRRLNNALCPRGEAQEKVLAPLQFVARFGLEWIDTLIDELDPFCSEHLLVDLEEDL